MAKLNVLNTIERTKGKINEYYDIGIKDIKLLIQFSNDSYELLYNAFVLGYAQGIKASKKGERL